MQSQCRLSGHDGTVWSVCFSPDGKQIASGSSDKTVNYLQSLFQDAGFSTRARNIPPVTTTGNKTIVGDLEVLGANMGDPKMRNLIVDVSIVHEFQGNDAAQDRNWVLRHQDLDRALNLRARKKGRQIPRRLPRS